VIAYKFLLADGTSPFTGFHWDLPDGGPGPWVEASADPCRSGVHACRAAGLPLWVSEVLYEIELEGGIVEGRSKVVAPRGRLLRRIVAWDEEVSNVYTRTCGDRAHELAHSVEPRLESWDAVVEPSIPEGPALLGFVAARIAEEISGREGYRAERTAQTGWLVKRLGLET
jgi:hypothetical protein